MVGGDVLAGPPGVRPAVERYLVQFAYLLHDLSEIPDDELRDRAMMTAVAKLVALCFKHARTSPDFITILRELRLQATIPYPPHVKHRGDGGHDHGRQE